MKRQYKEKFKTLRQFFPIFFWYECSSCGNEFRREWGWQALTGPWHGGHGTWRHLCRDCAPNFDTANNFFLKNLWLGNKPPIYPESKGEL